MARDYTPIPFEFLEEMDGLSDEEYGRLIRAAQIYSINGKEPELPGTERLFWKRVKNTIDRFTESFESRRSSSQENGKKGGRPPKSENPEKPIGFWNNLENPEVFEETQKTQSESESESESKANSVYKRAKRFSPPTLAEVQAYVSERHSPVDPQGFIDFYASKGWMVGKTPMKDWKAACRNAEKWDRWAKKGGNNGRFAEDAVAQYGNIGTVV